MNDDQIDDLKQFITTITQQAVTDGIAGAELRLTKHIENLSQEMHEGFEGVGEAIGQLNDSLDTHEHRIPKVENQPTQT